MGDSKTSKNNKIKIGVLRKNTYLYFPADELNTLGEPLVDSKIISWHGNLLMRVVLPKGSQVIANSRKLYVIAGKDIIEVFRFGGHFFLVVNNGNAKPIVLPDGPPPPYPLSLIS